MNSGPRLLVLAGHDPTGGAGIDADEEAAAHFGIPADLVITAFTDSAEALRLQVADEVGVKEWWRRLLFLALGILCLELLLAWRFSE